MSVIEEKSLDEIRENARLNTCIDCGCHGSGACGRMIARDGSVWPNHDTGFRVIKETKKIQEYSNV